MNRELHFQLYSNGNIGMANLMMSAEVGIAIAYLTKRTPILYAKNGLFNSTKGVSLGDLFDFEGVVFKRETLLSSNLPCLPPNLMQSVITNGKAPSVDFRCGRSQIVDLSNYGSINTLATSDDKSLGFYSYLFCLHDSERIRVIDRLKTAMKPKLIYQDAANSWINYLQNKYGRYNSIQIRRKDYLGQAGTVGASKTMADFIDVLLAHIPTDELLVIHTDETDEKYFSVIKRYYTNILLIDHELSKQFPDDAENGLVSMLIAQQSNRFIGTMYSTFAEMIRRKRIQNGLLEEWVYLYSQNEGIPLHNGRILEDKTGEYSWNRITMPETQWEMNCWWREWEECVI